MADQTTDGNRERAKVIQLPPRHRRKVRPRRPSRHPARPPTQLISSVQLILSRLGLCGAD